MPAASDSEDFGAASLDVLQPSGQEAFSGLYRTRGSFNG